MRRQYAQRAPIGALCEGSSMRLYNAPKSDQISHGETLTRGFHSLAIEIRFVRMYKFNVNVLLLSVTCSKFNSNTTSKFEVRV